MLSPPSKSPPIPKQQQINKMFITLALLCIIIEALPQGSIPHDLDQLSKGNHINNSQEHEFNFPSKTSEPGNLSIAQNETHRIFEDTDPLEQDQDGDDWDRLETATTPTTPANSQQTTANNGTTIITAPSQSTADNITTTTEAVNKKEEDNRRYLWSNRVKDGDTSPGYHLGRTIQDIKSDPMHMFLTISLPIALCGISLALLCIFGLKPDGYLCKKIFSVDCEVMVQKI